ncbi:serine/threonine-protein phosphatase 7-like isoform X1 [Senna tora]|uniref:Serine/threonine-protein phosphatase 7-like isoform X1 n=1 Tax=Senna tora TaxID=362788 RepID=A0A834T2X9_9FABA|nr:serine/threonine-protein phosphatase 7-like isoform X1 [Senna tora]
MAGDPLNRNMVYIGMEHCTKLDEHSCNAVELTARLNLRNYAFKAPQEQCKILTPIDCIEPKVIKDEQHDDGAAAAATKDMDLDDYCFLLDSVMDLQKERIKSGCQKILEGIDSMSSVNFDDQQVHSLVMMREIARGVVDDQDRNYRENGLDCLFHEQSIMVLDYFADDCITLEWIQDMMLTLEQALQKMLPSEFCHVIPSILVDKLTEIACSILCKEPNCEKIQESL